MLLRQCWALALELQPPWLRPLSPLCWASLGYWASLSWWYWEGMVMSYGHVVLGMSYGNVVLGIDGYVVVVWDGNVVVVLGIAGW